MKVPLQRNSTINMLLSNNVTTIKIAMEYSKVNLPAQLAQPNGFLTIELLIGLFLCVFLSTIIMKYQWYSITWQADACRRLRVIHLLEELIEQLRLQPTQAQRLFPLLRDDITITLASEESTIANIQLWYLHAQWQSLGTNKLHTIKVPVMIIP